MSRRLLLNRGGASIIAPPQTDWIAAFQSGSVSGEVFGFGTGINEFDLLYVGGSYVWAYDNKTETKIKTASTVGGLQAASAAGSISGRFPGIGGSAGDWHAWVQHPSSYIIRHYTASVLSSWSLDTSFGSGHSDPQVRQDPVTGLWWLTYKAVSPLTMGIYTADDPDGPWTDQGLIFDDIGAPSWAANEEADPCPAFIDGRAYVTYAGWDGVTQLVAMVEVHRDTYRASNAGAIIRTPTADWEGAKIFSPVYLDDGVRKRIYYSVNGDGAAVGWGYIEAVTGALTLWQATAGVTPTGIAAIGTSITHGVGASDGAHQWTSLLQDAMDAEYGAGAVTVNENGIESATAATFADTPANIDLGSPDPALVIIELGVNDMALDVSPTDFRADVETIMTTVRSSLATDPSFLLVALYTIGDSYTNPWQDYVDQLSVIANGDAAVRMLELRSPFGDPTTTYLDSDLVHPNNAGHQLFADEVVALIT